MGSRSLLGRLRLAVDILFAGRRDKALRKVDGTTYSPTRYRCACCGSKGFRVRMFSVRGERIYACLLCGTREDRGVVKASWERY